jgi:hypothetical protein
MHKHSLLPRLACTLHAQHDDSRLLRLVLSIPFVFISFFFGWVLVTQPNHVARTPSTALWTPPGQQYGFALSTANAAYSFHSAYAQITKFSALFMQKATQEIKTGRKTVLPYLTKSAPKALGESGVGTNKYPLTDASFPFSLFV